MKRFSSPLIRSFSGHLPTVFLAGILSLTALSGPAEANGRERFFPLAHSPNQVRTAADSLPAEKSFKPGGPRWDLKSFFPSFDHPTRQAFRDQVRRDLAKVTEAMLSLPPLDTAHLASWEKALRDYEDLFARTWHYSTYIGCLTSEDANNTAFQAEAADDAQTDAEMQKLATQLKRGLRSVDETTFAAFLRRPALKGAEHFVRRLREEALRSMAVELENLNADLAVEGIGAWGRMYEQLAGKLEFDMVFPNGNRERKPITEVPTLLSDPDPRVRLAAYTGGNKSWQQFADPIAHALNHISGWRLVLNQYRKIPDILDNALFEADMKRETLEAMFGALKKHIEIPRSMARLKARSMGLPALGWQDLDAPLPGDSEGRFTWQQSSALLSDAFKHRLPDMAGLLETMEQKHFCEAEVRSGKAPGAFCTDSPLTGESRIFLTFGGTLGDVYTMAHEGGHAYNNEVMKDLRPLARSMPNTLAETASTFGELTFTRGILANPDVPAAQKARVLNMEVNNTIGYLLDVPCRFAFEKALYAERTKGEVSVERLQELMKSAQQEFFGDVLSPEGDNPWFWASKGHFYFADSTFYNFPYTFGFLLSRGLMAEYQKQGEAFLPKYREFLRLSGSLPTEEVARQTLGIDLTKPEFWELAILSLQEFRDEFEKTVVKKISTSSAPARKN